jgi:hypothetical protein
VKVYPVRRDRIPFPLILLLKKVIIFTIWGDGERKTATATAIQESFLLTESGIGLQLYKS